MNQEATTWRREALDEVVIEDAAAQRRRRRNWIIGGIAALVALIALAFLLMPGGNEAAPPAAGPQAGRAGAQLPAVTVIVPGRQDVAGMISATGTLAARRDLPVGVAGEGGMISRVLVEPGAWVRAGQTLAVIERAVQTQQAEQLRASIEVARADAALAQAELERAQALVSRGFISQADIDRKTATRDAASARVRVAQAQLSETQARIGRLDIRAPAAGLVLDRNVEAGQVVGAGSGALFRIAQGGEMELIAQVAQQDLARVNVGAPATVTPIGSDESVQGSVWQVSPIIDPQTRQGEVRISIPYNRALRPGGFATAEMTLGSANAPLLPESAVMSDEQGNFVYIVTPDDTVERRGVTIATVDDRGVVISEGLEGTERVVRSAGAFLTPGARVRPELARAR